MNGKWTWSPEQWAAIVNEAKYEQMMRNKSKSTAISADAARFNRLLANRAAARVRNAAHRAEYCRHRPVLTLI